MDLLQTGDGLRRAHGLEPINYLAAKQEQQPCEIVVLSLVSNQPKIHIESLAGAGIPQHPDLAHRPDDPISINAEHRMERAVQNLKMIGFQASGIISYEDLVVGRAADRVSGGPSSAAIELGSLSIPGRPAQ